MECNSLIKALDAMRLEDGMPDATLRKSAIQQLLDSSILTFGELRMIKDHFRKQKFKRDIIVKLPIELVALVMAHLSLEDYLIMRSVSREWRQRVHSGRICSDLLKVHFRGTWEREFAPLSDTDKQLYLEKVSGILRSMVVRRVKRMNGIYHGETHYAYPNPNLESFSLPLNSISAGRGISTQFQYSNGRVASRVDPNCIQVSNLRTRIARHYREEQRRTFESWQLSNKFLLGYVDHPKPRLYAWLLDHEDDPIYISLEYQIGILAAYNNQVVLRGGGYTQIWTIGHGVQQLELLDRDKDDLLSFREVIFHPFTENHFFIFYQPYKVEAPDENGFWDGETWLPEIVVQEMFEGKTRNVLRKNLVPFWSDLQNSCAANIEFMDSDGLVAISGSEDVNEVDEDFKQYSSMSSIPCRDETKRNFFMTFNCFTLEFREYANHFGIWNQFFNPLELEQFHGIPVYLFRYWRGQLMFLDYQFRRGVAMRFLNPCGTDQGILNNNSRLKVAGKCIDDDWNICHHGPTFHFRELNRVVCRGAVQINDPDLHIPSIVWCDDDFIVYNHKDGYTVWSFDEGTSSPTDRKLVKDLDEPMTDLDEPATDSDGSMTEPMGTSA